LLDPDQNQIRAKAECKGNRQKKHLDFEETGGDSMIKLDKTEVKQQKNPTGRKQKGHGEQR